MAEFKEIGISNLIGNREGYMDSFIVLRKKESKDGRIEFITHVWTPENNAYFWGHYFTDKKDAWKDFGERCDKYGVGGQAKKEIKITST